MSRHLKVLTTLMMWVVITAGIAATSPSPASASPELAGHQRVDVGALLTTAALNNSPNLSGLSPLGITGRVPAPEDDTVEGGEGVEGYFEDLGDETYRPAPRISPPVGAQQIVGMYTWLAIDPDAWTEVQWDGRENDAGMVYTAAPRRTIWTFSDQIIECDGPGAPYTEGAVGPPPCGRTWTHTTEVAAVTMEVAIEYEVTWAEYEEECYDLDESESCDSEKIDGSEGSYIQKGDSLDTYDLRVGEIQSIGTAENLEELATGVDYRAEQEEIGSKRGYDSCGALQVVCDFAEDVRDELIDQLSGAIGFVVQTLMQGISWLRSILPDWLKVVLDFFEGCVDQFDQILEGVLSSVSEILAGPVAYFSNLFADIILLIQAISSDPVEFAIDFLYEELELEEAEENLASWVGGWACEFALEAVTGGSTYAQDLRDWLDDLSDAFDTPDVPTTKPTRPEDGPSDDSTNTTAGNDGTTDTTATLTDAEIEEAREEQENYEGDTEPICTDSFPTGTPVLGADGSYIAIELVKAGDEVLSFDPDTATWSARTVTSQWSNLDAGAMATVVLEDGSQLTATDHHPFWEANSQAWVDAEDLSAGDLLAGPDETYTVASVAVHEPVPNLVWELSVEVDHTFAVSTGTADIAVHNATCLRPGTPAHRANRWAKYQARGGTKSKSAWDNVYSANQTKSADAAKRMDDVKKILETTYPTTVFDREHSVATSFGTRRMDIVDLSTRHGIEHKSGDYTTVTKHIRDEIKKDVALMNLPSNQIWSIEWIFDGTASQPLKDLLDQHGIPYKEDFAV